MKSFFPISLDITPFEDVFPHYNNQLHIKTFQIQTILSSMLHSY